MWQRVPSLETALALAQQMKASGNAKWFRGQSRTWPLLSSFVRESPRKQEVAIERFGRFHRWMQSVPALEELARNEDTVLAIAQHYGLATMLVDFTTEPKVAAFFAAHNSPPPDEGEDISCIICLDLDELRTIYEMTKIVRPDMPEPRAITLKVPDLWRIQSQCGVFLEYPFDAGFERHFFNFDRIVFPTERDPAVLSGLIPVEDIYPSQKSDLEVLLDQFFMLERSMEGSRVFEDMVQAGRVSHVRAEGVPHGIEVECFGHAGLPIHESWEASRLTDWMLPESEDWQPMSGASKVSVHYPHRGSSLEKIQIMQRYILEAIASDPSLRSCPIKWTLHDINASTSRIVRAMELVWDGLRRWPYGSGEIAQALATVIEYGTLVTFDPHALYDGELAVALAEQCFGDVIEVEMAMEDGSYTRGCCNTEVLRRAVRDDFLDFLKGDWQTKIDNIYHILQIAPDLKRVFVFDRLKSVFSTQIVPTQAVLRNEESGKARLYNPARATRVGLP